MSEEFNDGGPAFPQLSVEVLSDHMAATAIHGGASLWDEYVKAVLQGLLAQQAGREHRECITVNELIQQSAIIADAVITEREKRRAR
jgi:hypothetical protein